MHLLDLDDQVAPGAQRRRMTPKPDPMAGPAQPVEDDVLDRQKKAGAEGASEENRRVLKIVDGPAYMEDSG